MTKDELKKELDALGIEYHKDAKLAELEALYAPYAPVKDSDAKNEDIAPEDDSQPVADGAEAPQATTVACPLLNMRTAPDGEIVFVAHEGQTVEVIEESDGWAHVQIDAWARSEFLG